MFNELYDSVSLVFYRCWPTANAAITRVCADPQRHGFQLRVAYEFSVGDDGRYVGESACPFWFGGTNLANINDKFQVGRIISVRYRRSDPSLNRIDPVFWKDMEYEL